MLSTFPLSLSFYTSIAIAHPSIYLLSTGCTVYTIHCIAISLSHVNAQNERLRRRKKDTWIERETNWVATRFPNAYPWKLNVLVYLGYYIRGFKQYVCNKYDIPTYRSKWTRDIYSCYEVSEPICVCMVVHVGSWSFDIKTNGNVSHLQWCKVSKPHLWQYNFQSS